LTKQQKGDIKLVGLFGISIEQPTIKTFLRKLTLCQGNKTSPKSKTIKSQQLSMIASKTNKKLLSAFVSLVFPSSMTIYLPFVSV
jgi:hypothetical protein